MSHKVQFRLVWSCCISFALSPLTRHPLDSTKLQRLIVTWMVALVGCASTPATVEERPWHQSPPSGPAWSVAYPVAEWSAVQKLRVGMTEERAAKTLGVPLQYYNHPVNAIVFTTSPDGKEFEVALKREGGKIVDVSYKRRAGPT